MKAPFGCMGTVKVAVPDASISYWCRADHRIRASNRIGRLIYVVSGYKEASRVGITNTAEPANPTAPPAKSTWNSLAFVLSLWLLTLLVALVFVWNYGGNVPFMDEWEIVPALVGEQEITVAWLWSQHNEHRLPLPRLVLLALYKLTGCDFRAGMFFNVIALSVLALAMILVATTLRSRASSADAFFPLVLLHWGHASNLLWSWQVAFVLPTVLAGILLLIVVRSGTQVTLRIAVLAGTCLVMLSLCGAVGMALLLAPALWLAYVGMLRCRSEDPSRRRTGFTLLAFVGAALLLFGLYFIGWKAYPTFPDAPSPHFGVTIAASIKFLATSFGPWARQVWPFSGWAALAVLFTSAVALLLTGRKDLRDRARVIGLGMFLCGLVLLALAVGKARGGNPTLPWEPRYVTLATLLWCSAYFVWGIYRPAATRRFAQRGLFLLILLQFVLNGWWWAHSSWWQYYRANMAAVQRDLVAGIPISRFAERHAEFLLPYAPKALPARVRMLQRAGIEPFRFLREDSLSHEGAGPSRQCCTEADRARQQEGFLAQWIGSNRESPISLKAAGYSGLQKEDGL